MSLLQAPSVRYAVLAVTYDCQGYALALRISAYAPAALPQKARQVTAQTCQTINASSEREAFQWHDGKQSFLNQVAQRTIPCGLVGSATSPPQRTKI